VKAVVVALGKVGLPLAARIALAGHDVVGADVDPRVVRLVNDGRPPFPNEAGLPEALAATTADGRLRAVTDTAAAVAEGPDLVVAVPPLVVDASARPDWGILDAVVADIGRGLKAGTTVSIETTVPVGTTRARVAPALEAASGLREGVDFHVVFSPERIFSGRAIADLDRYPKLVGGLSAAGEARGIELYASFLDAEVRGLGSAEAAELSKLAETTYRDINIAFANELARYADTLGVDVLSVIDAANSQPYSHVHRPGIAVGGHCIPVYPRFLLAGDADARLPLVAREVNERMPAYAADLVPDGVAGRRVLILGIAYRGGVKETAFSGAFALRDTLVGRGAEVVAADPLFDDDELRGHGFAPWDGTSPIDVAIVQADHTNYATLTTADLPGVQVIVDGRGILDASRFPGIPVRRIGRPEGTAADAGSEIAPRS
jgi:UDP-N-acetyl-D-glucosamine dehydrogenase